MHDRTSPHPQTQCLTRLQTLIADTPEGNHRVMIRGYHDDGEGNSILVGEILAEVPDDPWVLLGLAEEFERRAAGLAELANRARCPEGLAHRHPYRAAASLAARSAESLQGRGLDNLTADVLVAQGLDTRSEDECAECGLVHAGSEA